MIGDKMVSFLCNESLDELSNDIANCTLVRADFIHSFARRIILRELSAAVKVGQRFGDTLAHRHFARSHPNTRVVEPRGGDVSLIFLEVK
jgi:hypothetical protein